MNLRLLGADGVFSAAAAVRHGIDSHELDRLVRAGRCERVSRGWYAVRDDPSQPLGAEHRHTRTAIALGRQFAARAAVSHHSLLLLHDLPTWRADLGTVHLTSTRPASATDVGIASRREGLVIHRHVPGLVVPTSSQPTSESTLPYAVPLGHAVVQAGLLAGPEAALVPADAALARRLVTREQLSAAVAALAGRRGIGVVRAAVEHADARHESPGESRTAYLLRALGHEADPQIEVAAEGRRYRADFRIRGTRVLVEFDGQVKYTDRAALFDEKRREDALRRTGWVVVRLVWSDLAQPDLVRRRLRDALRAAVA
ncbi:type IV toxin-antitoxin system AbiEi family antitoxin domain-containing protein [Terrabacter terrigena]|uniref:Type IV toxin-antitoxin system AbiEi family antitoxin domain-containing protein n=1 Tax=Terrabacter terrigena TaxID=574718 RepID=A0ABW3MVA7_9MICO